MQLLLFVIAGIALFLLVVAFRRGRTVLGLFSLVVGALAVLLLYGLFVIQSYGPTNNTLVARVKAVTIANTSAGNPMMSVEITLYDHGQATSDATYIVQGDRWELQGDVIKVSGLMSTIGLHSGFKLTRLEGRYNNPDLEANANHSVVTLNGGDDGFFQITQFFNGFLAPVVDAFYGSAVSNGTGTYKIYASQSSLWAQGA